MQYDYKTGIYLFNDPFPIGLATTNRAISLSKGLSLVNVKMSILIIRATEDKKNVLNTKVRGKYDCLDYEYISKTTVKSSNKLFLVYSFIQQRLKLFALLFNRRKTLSFVIYPLDSLLTLIVVKLALWNSLTKIIRHVDEFPPFVLNPQKFSKLYVWIYKAFFYRIVDAVIPMTYTLADYYRNIAPQTMPFKIIPMTVDFNRFCDLTISKENYITYCGNLGYNNKDGLPDLINAFKIIADKYTNFKLKIIGSSKQMNEVKVLYELVHELNLSDRVIFTGAIPSYDVPRHLISSKVLVLSRPANKQAEGGFPTKLGEYLATGNPVVVTRVGEIDRYLIDGESAYIAKPNDFSSFAKKLDELLSNYEKALLVGKNGRLVALRNFDYKVQGANLYSFINSL